MPFRIGVHFKGDRVDALSNRLIRRISYSDNVEKDYELLVSTFLT